MTTQNKSVQKSGQLTRRKLFALTRHHFNLPAQFKPLIYIAINYVGQWDIINLQSEVLGVTQEQKDFMLDLIKQHGFKGGAL